MKKLHHQHKRGYEVIPNKNNLNRNRTHETCFKNHTCQDKPASHRRSTHLQRKQEHGGWWRPRSRHHNNGDRNDGAKLIHKLEHVRSLQKEMAAGVEPLSVHMKIRRGLPQAACEAKLYIQWGGRHVKKVTRFEKNPKKKRKKKSDV